MPPRDYLGFKALGLRGYVRVSLSEVHGTEELGVLKMTVCFCDVDVVRARSREHRQLWELDSHAYTCGRALLNGLL